MTDEPAPEDPSQAKPKEKKGKGCFLGGLATVGAWIGGGFLAGIVLSVLAGVFEDDGSLDTFGPILGVVAFLIPVGLIVAAGYYWRKTPGFLLGIGLTIALTFAIGTACAALLYSTA